MKTLYLDCGMGAAGDMLTAALLELTPDPDAVLAELNALGLPGVEYHRETVAKCGINGTHVRVTVHGEEEESHDAHTHEHHEHEHAHGDEHEHTHEHHHHDDHEHVHEHHHHDDHDHVHEHYHDHAHTHSHEHGHHHHTSLHDIEHIIRDHLDLPESVRNDILAVYGLIAEAESHAHGRPIDQIHFHEVGTMDAVADVTAVCLLMHRLAPEQVIVSPVHVGSGQVVCAHGTLPVPAPATAFILRDVPIYGGQIRGELCTPTGAALLKHFAARFGDMPVLRTEAIGYGMGKKDFEVANCVRALLGYTDENKNVVAELSCNVDDMTPEAIGFAMEQFFAAGALEVYTVPVGMKKSRPGILLNVMCMEERKDEMIRLILKHTTTIGIRENISRRYTMRRTVESIDTTFGPVRCKSSEGYGTARRKYEYEDIARIARENGLSLKEVEAMLP